MVKKLKQLELHLNPENNSVLEKAIMDASAVNPSLETWLKDSVLALYPDTKDCCPALANFFNAQKYSSGSKNLKGAQQMLPTICHRPLSSSGSLEQRDVEESCSYMSSSSLGFAVKQLTSTDLQNCLLYEGNETGSKPMESPVQMKRNLGSHRSSRIWDSYFPQSPGYIFERITYFTVLGCIAFATIKFSGIGLSKTLTGPHWAFTKANNNITWTADLADNPVAPAYIRKITMANKLKRILSMFKIQLLHQAGAGNDIVLRTTLTSSSSPINVSPRPMPVEEAETIVRQWQTIKAEALGPSLEVNCLAQVLDESMLAQWKDLANAAKERSFYWRIRF